MKSLSLRYVLRMFLSDSKFKQLIGVNKAIFQLMLDILTRSYVLKHSGRGWKAKLSLWDMLFMTLKYWRSYCTHWKLKSLSIKRHLKSLVLPLIWGIHVIFQSTKRALEKQSKTPSVIIMDNARFHRMSRLKELCEEHGHKLLRLPPYSPEYNPIEKTWAHIKNTSERYYQFAILFHFSLGLY